MRELEAELVTARRMERHYYRLLIRAAKGLDRLHDYMKPRSAKTRARERQMELLESEPYVLIPWARYLRRYGAWLEAVQVRRELESRLESHVTELTQERYGIPDGMLDERVG